MKTSSDIRAEAFNRVSSEGFSDYTLMDVVPDTKALADAERAVLEAVELWDDDPTNRGVQHNMRYTFQVYRKTRKEMGVE